jgi:hypothetical protein
VPKVCRIVRGWETLSFIASKADAALSDSRIKCRLELPSGADIRSSLRMPPGQQLVDPIDLEVGDATNKKIVKQP